MPLWYFAWVFSRHPIVIVPPALVLAILYGAGKPFGLPRLFWNERPSVRFSAGVAMTLLFGDALLVAYLLDGADAADQRLSFLQFALVGGAVWVLLVGARVVQQELRYLRSKRRNGHGMGQRTGIAPAIRQVGDAGLSSKAALQVPALTLAAGVAVGALVAFTLAVLARTAPVAWLTAALYVLAANLRHPGSEPWLHGLALISFALLLGVFALLKKRASPGVGLCFLLAIGLAFYTATEFWFQHAGLGLLIVLVLLWLAGGLKYKLRNRR